MALSTNPATVRSREWRQKNPDRAREHASHSRARRRSPCIECGGPMPFPSANGQQMCSEECVQQRKRRRDANYYSVLQERVWKHKTSIGCYVCGYDDHGAALDWHHDDNNKERRITIKSYFTELGGAERKKCVLLCSNCHRRIHAEDLKIEQNGAIY